MSTPQLESAACGRLIRVSVPHWRPNVKRIGRRRRPGARVAAESGVLERQGRAYRDYPEFFSHGLTNILHRRPISVGVVCHGTALQVPCVERQRAASTEEEGCEYSEADEGLIKPTESSRPENPGKHFLAEPMPRQRSTALALAIVDNLWIT